MKKEVGRPAGHGDNAAITHIRVSLSTKAFDRLKAEHGYQTSDEVLANLLPQSQSQLQSYPSPQPQPQLTTQSVITRDMLQRPDVNKLISDTAREVYHNHVKPGSRPRQSRPKQSKPKSKQSKSSFKSNYKF